MLPSWVKIYYKASTHLYEGHYQGNVITLKWQAVFNTQNEFKAVCNAGLHKYQQLCLLYQNYPPYFSQFYVFTIFS